MLLGVMDMKEIEIKPEPLLTINYEDEHSHGYFIIKDIEWFRKPRVIRKFKKWLQWTNIIVYNHQYLLIATNNWDEFIKAIERI